MGISNSVALWLKSRGYDAIHLNDQNLFQLPDDKILSKAIHENRIVLTSDTDFGKLVALNKIAVASIVQFSTSDFTPPHVRERLSLVFEKFSEELKGNFILTIEDHRIRFRKLPI